MIDIPGNDQRRSICPDLPATRRGHAALALVALWALICCAGCGSSAPPAPVAFSTYVSPGETFQIEYPTDWDSDGDAKRGLEWAEFTSGSCEVSVKTDVSGSLMGDISNNGARGRPQR
ncbi:MAG: hypothetical protein R3C10_20065 [Pirellulales bacterium]